MSKKTKTGAKVAAGRAEPRLQSDETTGFIPRVTLLHEVRPFMGMSEAQISATVRQAQGHHPSGRDRVLQSLFTVRNDATVGDALDTINLLLYQAHGGVTTMSEDTNLEEAMRAKAWGLVQLIEQAQAALSVVDNVRHMPQPALRVEL